MVKIIISIYGIYKKHFGTPFINFDPIYECDLYTKFVRKAIKNSLYSCMHKIKYGNLNTPYRPF